MRGFDFFKEKRFLHQNNEADEVFIVPAGPDDGSEVEAPVEGVLPIIEEDIEGEKEKSTIKREEVKVTVEAARDLEGLKAQLEEGAFAIFETLKLGVFPEANFPDLSGDELKDPKNYGIKDAVLGYKTLVLDALLTGTNAEKLAKPSIVGAFANIGIGEGGIATFSATLITAAIAQQMQKGFENENYVKFFTDNPDALKDFKYRPVVKTGLNFEFGFVEIPADYNTAYEDFEENSEPTTEEEQTAFDEKQAKVAILNELPSWMKGAISFLFKNDTEQSQEDFFEEIADGWLGGLCGSFCEFDEFGTEYDDLKDSMISLSPVFGAWFAPLDNYRKSVVERINPDGAGAEGDIEGEESEAGADIEFIPVAKGHFDPIHTDENKTFVVKENTYTRTGDILNLAEGESLLVDLTDIDENAELKIKNSSIGFQKLNTDSYGDNFPTGGTEGVKGDKIVVTNIDGIELPQGTVIKIVSGGTIA